MSSRTNSLSPLSFLDLLCCGLGGIMLLFMILIAVKEQFDFVPPPQLRVPETQEQSLFIIAVTSVGTAPLFDPLSGPNKGPIQIRGESPKRALPDSWSERHAMLLALQPPAPDSQIRIGPFSTQAKQLDLQVIERGQRLHSERIIDLTSELSGDRFLTVWPRSNPIAPVPPTPAPVPVTQPAKDQPQP